MSNNIVVTGANRISPIASAIASQYRQPGNNAGQTTDVALAETANSNAPLLNSGLEAPKPPRFPWLSRLSTELEPSAKQKPSFPSAPSLGDNLDQAA